MVSVQLLHRSLGTRRQPVEICGGLRHQGSQIVYEDTSDSGEGEHDTPPVRRVQAALGKAIQF
jgi:hypothetical protein